MADTFSITEQEAARELRHALKRLHDLEQRMAERLPHSEAPGDEDVAWVQARLKAQRELADTEVRWIEVTSMDR